jgi:two-component system cell cycle sensor histidine kinase/response regulator CckA
LFDESYRFNRFFQPGHEMSQVTRMSSSRLSVRITSPGFILAFLGLVVLLLLSASFSFAFHGLELGQVLQVFAGLLAVCLIFFVARQMQREATADTLFQGIVETIPDCGILTVNMAGVIVAANSQCESLFGVSRDELVGKPLGQFVNVGAKLSESGNGRLGEIRARRRNSEELFLEVSRTRPVPTPDGLATLFFLQDVTRLKQIIEQLRQRETHLKLVVEQMPAILWTTDSKLTITSTLGGGLASLNMRPDEVIGMTMLEHLETNDVESTPIAAHRKALAGESLSYEMEWRRRHFQVRVEPLHSEDRKITGTIGLVMDVTDRKQTVAELKARARQQATVAELGQKALDNSKLAAVFQEAAPLIARTLDVEFSNILEAAPDGAHLSVRAAFGWKNQEQASPVEIGNESQAKQTLVSGTPILVDDLAAETRYPGSKLIRRHKVRSGLTVPIPGRKQPFGVLGAYSTEKCKFTHDHVSFMQGMANVLGAAVERKQSEEAQARLVAILEATTDCVAIASENQKILYLNQAGRSLLGIGLQEDVGNFSLADFFANEESRQLLKDGLLQAANKGAWQGHTLLKNRAGDGIRISQVILAHKSPTGAVQFFSTIGRDLREFQRLEEQFRQAQKMEAVGRMAGGIAHDFNNLLCVINGYSGILVNDFPDEDPRKNQVKEIKKAGDRAAALTRQLLAFSRKQMLVPCVLNLNTLVSNMESMLRRLIGEDIELITNLDPRLYPIKADPSQVEQILLNMAVNARDAIAQEGRLIIATGNAELDEAYALDHPEVKPGQYAMLSVTDSGCGMGPEVLAHLFEPFFTTKEVGKGTGLGLATVYGIVKQSDGHIEVSSQPGHGTTFKVYLPRIEEKPSRIELDTSGQPIKGGHETLLLVEDDQDVRLLTRQILMCHGYKVLEAGNGEEALALVKTFAEPIHLVVSDVVMPRVSGGELAKRLAEVKPNIKVMFVSGYTDSKLVQRGIVSGEVDCLLKPFSAEALLNMVREVLDRSQAQTSNRRRARRRKPQASVHTECFANDFGLGPNLAAGLINISEGGIALLVKNPLDKDKKLEVHLSNRGQPSIKRRASVAWILPADNGMFQVGLKFDQLLDFPELQHLT